MLPTLLVAAGIVFGVVLSPWKLWTKYFINHLGNVAKFTSLMHLGDKYEPINFEVKGQGRDRSSYGSNRQTYASATPRW